MLMNELKNIRIEVAKIVEAERDRVQDTLERENVTIQRQLMTICATNKHEIINSMRRELIKHLQSAQNKVFFMTDALKQEMDNLRCEVEETQVSILFAIFRNFNNFLYIFITYAHIHGK